jgi:lysozyme
MDKVKEIIKQFEGLRLKVYKDQAGFLTVGYGHRVLPQDRLLWQQSITQAQADAFLDFDLERTKAGVLREVLIPLNDNQLAALVSLAFNIGIGAFGRSTLLECLNTNKMHMAAEQFVRWDHVNGAPNGGLLKRRRLEQALFLS